VTLLLLLTAAGCGTGGQRLRIAATDKAFPAGTIIAAATGEAISFEALCDALAQARVVYIGERHTDPAHHANQLAVLQALRRRHPGLQLGMEMFDRTYQAVLDDWRQNRFEPPELPRRTHWVANWRHDFALYAAILQFVRETGMPLVALNIPFHIPPKIAVGGLDSLTPGDALHLPRRVDLEHAEHRAFVHDIFQLHRIPGRENFEFFYAAQCVWEDVMAESIVNRLAAGPMVVLAGNGHIQYRYGIPLRAAGGGATPFRTVVQLPAGGSVDLSIADFIWVTPP
jgi:uncharacterized iron-regulated protein